MRRQNGRCRRRSAPEAARRDEVLMVIRVAEIPVRDGLSGTRGMNEAPSTCINPHVIHVPAVDAEEHQVAG